jgi:hypothetical protein
MLAFGRQNQDSRILADKPGALGHAKKKKKKTTRAIEAF